MCWQKTDASMGETIDSTSILQPLVYYQDIETPLLVLTTPQYVPLRTRCLTDIALQNLRKLLLNLDEENRNSLKMVADHREEVNKPSTLRLNLQWLTLLPSKEDDNITKKGGCY